MAAELTPPIVEGAQVTLAGRETCTATTLQLAIARLLMRAAAEMGVRPTTLRGIRLSAWLFRAGPEDANRWGVIATSKTLDQVDVSCETRSKQTNPGNNVESIALPFGIRYSPGDGDVQEDANATLAAAEAVETAQNDANNSDFESDDEDDRSGNGNSEDPESHDSDNGGDEGSESESYDVREEPMQQDDASPCGVYYVSFSAWRKVRDAPPKTGLGRQAPRMAPKMPPHGLRNEH